MKEYPFFYFVILLVIAPSSYALEKEEIADYLGVEPRAIYVECQSNAIHITENNYLKFCLSKKAREKRCEISVNTFSKAPWLNRINYSFRLSGDALKEKHHYALMQIHSFPDTKLGEKWRCPPLTMDMTGDHLSIHNRSDKERLSKTYRYNCNEPGSSITSRAIYNQAEVQTNKWYDFSLSSRFSYKDDGLIKLKFDDQPLQEFSGANSYNDNRVPFLKLGIYKPTPWESGQEKICVEYKRFDYSKYK